MAGNRKLVPVSTNQNSSAAVGEGSTEKNTVVANLDNNETLDKGNAVGSATLESVGRTETDVAGNTSALGSVTVVESVGRTEANLSDNTGLKDKSTTVGSAAVGKEAAEEESSCQRLSHTEVKEVLHKALAQLLSTDPILGDLHSDMTHQEVSGLLEVEAGRSMLVHVQRADGAVWDLRVPRDARLHQLKAALKTHVTLAMHRRGCKRSLSWRSMWRRHWLVDRDGSLLADDNAPLSSLGVAHKHTLSFVKRNRNKTQTR